MLRKEEGRVSGGNYYYCCCCCCYSGGGDKERNIISIVHILIYVYTMYLCGPGSSVGIATDYGLDGLGSRSGTRFSARPDQPWGPSSLLYNGYRVFPGGKVRPGRAADHSPPSSAAVMEEKSYTSTHSLAHIGPVTGSLYYVLVTVIIYKTEF